jgi:hypothetical protein
LSDIDILGPSDRRRVRSAQEKAALLAEVDAEGGKVRDIQLFRRPDRTANFGTARQPSAAGSAG